MQISGTVAGIACLSYAKHHGQFKEIVARPQVLVRVRSLPAIQADMDQLMARFTPEVRRLVTRLDYYRHEYVAPALDEFVDAEPPATQENVGQNYEVNGSSPNESLFL